MSSPAISPPDDQLRDAIQAVRADPHNTGIGVSKIQAAVVKAHPGWTVSDKRVRKLIREETDAPANGASEKPKTNGKSKASRVYPTSKVLEGLDVAKWTTKVEVKYFGKAKGKGLIAKEKIEEGEVVWKEDPFALAPEWDIYDLQRMSAACAICSTPLTNSNITTNCPANNSTSLHCPARYCNRLCLSRAAKNHSLLCPAQNPASVPLMAFTRQMDWMALHAVSQCTARILMSNDAGEKTRDEDWTFVKALAELGMEERVKDAVYSKYLPEPNRDTWKKAHTLFVHAFKEPPNPQDQKKLARILKTPLPTEIANELFDYDAFLHALGRMSLNLEAHGGLYVLHSHLNHSCTPNVTVRHLDTRKALSRITVVAKSEIQPGEELLITYVNPELGLQVRRAELSAWGFGVCDCRRCKEEEVKEKKDAAAAAEGEVEKEPEAPVGELLPDLEKELKASFGVM